ncbi:tRNA (adenosine(37)-N6)-threonylcarbamoyltransferase complex dimerization subunit type 1 TsaB [Humisphaera borealis]|uniref:tRNA (Adenosine(37)-N6)-threonylcarbamoyltransferase complex dimerization subunit type 1 TsaB n=1 Tax=Humisphaera borealis TaxID=2807512 RepID=A0A7M2WXX8_9BACT|nr:tRNA (adenosine(37)-N6)-threonylcarbamoyltransferase complex dimerization subunit type 1 TsaB [Humisphaera borealis]QOV90263.1 tRNA (adenosine(37)-N6)-threonylcarbamoyltransferase complex dimerization subunit type 1 TsaB [Humisphaera borealis]
MIRGLAIETSGRLGSVALAVDGTSVAEDRFAHGLQHAAEIIPRIDALCKAQGWRPGEIDEIYISTGPGSFTGLRIGVTLAKTLAFATGARIVAVPSARVLAYNAPAEAQNVVIVLDAKRDQIFTARLAKGATGQASPLTGDWNFQEEPRLDALSAALARSPRPVHLVGEGIPFHSKFLPTDDGVILSPEANWTARATVVAMLGYDMARQARFTTPDELLPVYIRKPEAEEKWEAAQAAASEL